MDNNRYPGGQYVEQLTKEGCGEGDSRNDGIAISEKEEEMHAYVGCERQYQHRRSCGDDIRD